MKALGAEELLDTWEQGLHQPLLQKMLILLVAAFPELETRTLAKLSIGQRDMRLFQLREHLFGTRLLNSALCPKCHKRVEWENNTSDFIEGAQLNNAIDKEFNISAEDYDIRLRLPNSLDIAAVANSEFDQAQPESLYHQLLSRCLIKIEPHPSSSDVSQLPNSVVEKVSQYIDELDPCADIRINMDCPECSNSWEILFDIASYLWTEVNDWAERTLRKIHKLATAYGWREKDILALSPLRRQLYIGMLES